MKQQKLKVYVNCLGVKNRCRKTERHMIKLGNHELGVSEDFLIQQGKSAVIREMRTIDQAILVITPVELEQRDGYISESVKLYDPAAKRIPLTVKDAQC